MQENTEVPKCLKQTRKLSVNQNTSDTVPPEEETNFTQVSDSEQEETNFTQMSDSEPEVFIRQHQPLTTTYVPYIEGPKMNWTVDDGLYNQFLKWKIKCENILDCELDMLSDVQGSARK